MNITKIQNDNLFKAFGMFIEAFRPYIVEILMKEAGERWPALFVESMFSAQKEVWNLGLKAGTSPENLIDYPHLKSFVLKYKDLLKFDFGKDANKLATRMETIYEVRNKLAHFREITNDEYTETFIQMKNIVRCLKMDELETELNVLQDAKEPVIRKTSLLKTDILQWYHNVNPHLDVRHGRLDESVFAANLAEVALGTGREIYSNPVVFFSKTYFTSGLKNIAKKMVRGLNGGTDSENRVISLQTGFGGGKTHTLISLYHLAKWGTNASKSEHTQELLKTTGAPEFTTSNIAVFTNATNDPVQGRKIEGNTIKTIWGELAWQLGGKEAYEIIRINDEKRIAPKGLFKKVLEKCQPALILIDELADYCVSALGVKVEASNLSEQTISFMQELTEAVSGTDRCVIIATLPASISEIAASNASQQILTALENRITRVGSNMKPVEDEEIYEVVRRRLFEDLGNTDEIEKVINSYSEMYQSLNSELPSYSTKTDFKDRLRKSYPFHPELIDMFRLRWASNPHFQRTRGVLRILAAIVSDIWKRQNSLSGNQYLIHTSDIVLSNIEALTSQITILNGSSWDSVINADVSGSSSNAMRIDNDVNEFGKHRISQGIATTILLGTFGSKSQNKGVGIDEIKLCMLKPSSFNHNDINGAIDRLESYAHYLYYSSSGQKRYWFDTTPNINILINQAKSDVKSPEIYSEILKRISDKTRSVQLFHCLINPSWDIPEQMKPTLIILSPQYPVNQYEILPETKSLIEKIATKKGNSERIYRNTILYMACTELGLIKLQDDLKNYLACIKINSEYNSQLEKEQREDLKKRTEESSKQAENSLVWAYSVIIKYSVKKGLELLYLKQFKDSLENQINTNVVSELKNEEWILDSVGLGTLRNNNLLPTLEQSLKTKDIYEAFLRYDDKPMITGINAVSASLQRYCLNGEFCIATGDGKNFTRFFFKEQLPFFNAEDLTYWIIDKNLIPLPPEIKTIQDNISSVNEDKTEDSTTKNENEPEIEVQPKSQIKKFKSITINGKVPLEKYTELFNYFISPFAMSGNKIDIEVMFKIKSSEASPLDESKQQYKNAKEAGKQLGLNLSEDIDE